MVEEKKAKPDNLLTVNQASYPEQRKAPSKNRRLLEEVTEEDPPAAASESQDGEEERKIEEFPPILDDDVHRFNGHLKFAHEGNDHNWTGMEEMPDVDHGEEPPDGQFTDDYIRAQRHEFYYGHSRHRVHEGYMDDHIPYFGGGEY